MGFGLYYTPSAPSRGRSKGDEHDDDDGDRDQASQLVVGERLPSLPVRRATVKMLEALLR